jgi:hypothetical protein
VVEAQAPAGEPQRYLLPLAVLWSEDDGGAGAPKLPHTIAEVRHGSTSGALLDASFDERFVRTLLEAMRVGDRSAGQKRLGPLRRHGCLPGNGAFRRHPRAWRRAEHVSLLVGEAAII